MIWLNGKIGTGDAAFSADDRGLLLGEAVFETLLVKDNVPQFWQAHLARLREACLRFDFDQPYDDATLKQGVLDLIAAIPKAARLVVRLTVTGGAGGRGLVPTDSAPPNWLIQLTPAPPQLDGLVLAISDIVRLAHAHPHKTTSYLDNILARRQARAAGADEAVMMNQYGRAACVAAGNLFVHIGKQLITPPTSEGALAGIVRHALLRAEQCAGLDICEGLVDADLLTRADGVFVTNSVQEILPASLSVPPNEAQKRQGLLLRDSLPQFLKF